MKMMLSCAAPPMKTELCLLYHWALLSHDSSLVDPPALGWELRHSMAFHTIFFQENTSSLLIFNHGDLIIDCAWKLRNSGNESGHTSHLTPHTSPSSYSARVACVPIHSSQHIVNPQLAPHAPRGCVPCMEQVRCSCPLLLAHRRLRSQAPHAPKPVAPFVSCHCKTKSNSRVVDVMCIDENVNLS